MSSKTLFRLSGWALLLGFVLILAGELLQQILPSCSDVGKFYTDSLFLPSYMLFWSGAFLQAFGLPGLYARVAEKTGLLGLLGFAILYYRLWDIDIIINRTLVYATLTVCVVGLYVLVVGYLGALFRSSGNLLISLIATGLVAILFQPLRGWLQKGVNRLLYGQRDEPYAVITRMSQQLAGTLAHEAVLPGIVETVASALKLPYAAILLKRMESLEMAADYGKRVEDTLALPLS